MKKSIVTISLSVLITFIVSGCESKNLNIPKLSMPKLSMPSFEISKKTLDRSLPRIENLKIQTSLSQVALEWKPLHDRQIAGYRILRGDNKGGFQLIKVIDDPYVAHFTDENLQQNRYNQYMISSFTKDGRVSVGTSIYVPKNKKPLTAVPFVTAVSGLPNRIKILWRIHPDVRVNSYLVQRQEHNSNQWRTISTIDKRLSVEYIDYDVQPHIPYNYRVIARTIEGILSPASQSASGASKQLPPPVTGIMSTTNLPKKIEIIWQASNIADVSHYRLYASDFKDGLYTLVGKTKSTHYIDKINKNGAVRFYRVTVVDKDGLESSQHTIPSKGATIGYLSAPNITVARIINNTIEIQWTNTDPRTVSYTVYKKYWDGWRPKKIKIVDFKETIFVDNKIQPDTTYTYYVVAMDKNGIPSEKSRSVNFSVDSTGSKTSKKSWF